MNLPDDGQTRLPLVPINGVDLVVLSPVRQHGEVPVEDDVVAVDPRRVDVVQRAQAVDVDVVAELWAGDLGGPALHALQPRPDQHQQGQYAVHGSQHAS